jgi:hypothetical protein
VILSRIGHGDFFQALFNSSYIFSRPTIRRYIVLRLKLSSHNLQIRRNLVWNINSRILTYLVTELGHSWEAANCAATHKLPSILRNPKAHHRVHTSTLLVPMLNQIDPIHTTSSYLSKIYFNFVHPPILGLPGGLFPSDFPSISYMHSSSPPFVLHALPISSSLTWSLCLARSTSYEVPHCVVFSNLPLLNLRIKDCIKLKSIISDNAFFETLWFKLKNMTMDSSKNAIIVLICHHHKLLDLIKIQRILFSFFCVCVILCVYPSDDGHLVTETCWLYT